MESLITLGTCIFILLCLTLLVADTTRSFKNNIFVKANTDGDFNWKKIFCHSCYWIVLLFASIVIPNLLIASLSEEETNTVEEKKTYTQGVYVPNSDLQHKKGIDEVIDPYTKNRLQNQKAKEKFDKIPDANKN